MGHSWHDSRSPRPRSLPVRQWEQHKAFSIQHQCLLSIKMFICNKKIVLKNNLVLKSMTVKLDNILINLLENSDKINNQGCIANIQNQYNFCSSFSRQNSILVKEFIQTPNNSYEDIFFN